MKAYVFILSLLFSPLVLALNVQYDFSNTLLISTTAAEARIDILFNTDLYRYVGASANLSFIPQQDGLYTIISYDEQGQELERKTVTIDQGSLATPTVNTDKQYYRIGESVSITATQGTYLYIAVDGERVRHDYQPTLTFAPEKTGTYQLMLYDDDVLLATTTFAVLPFLPKQTATTENPVITFPIGARNISFKKPFSGSFRTDTLLDVPYLVMDKTTIQPGLYEITYDDDLGEHTLLFSWGLLSINTKKSAYRPGERIEVYVVALDSAGKPLENAPLQLSAVAPSGNRAFFFTEDQTLLPVSPGIYLANFTTWEEGTFFINATSSLPESDISAETTFLVTTDLPFEIIREVPFMIDPWTAPFMNIFSVQDNIGADQYTLTETLPEQITILSTNAELTTTDGKTVLSWDSNIAQPYYVATTPLISPFLYQLGPATIIAENVTYAESRPWSLAVDPQTHFKMEIKTIGNAGTTWQHVNFTNTFLTPVPIVAAVPAVGWATNDPPFGVNVRNLTATGVDVRISIPDRQFGVGVMPADNTIYLAVVEEGFWNSASSNINFTIEARSLTSSSRPTYTLYDAAMLGTYSTSVNLNSSWGSTSRTFQLSAALDANDTWIATALFGSTSRGNPPSQTQTTGILASTSAAQVTTEYLHEQEALYMIVIQTGTFNFYDIKFNTFRTSDSIDEYTAGDAPAHGLGQTPAWGVLSQVAQDQNEGGWANWRKSPFLAGTVLPYIQEDRYTDSEVLLSSENVDIFLANLSSWSYADQSSMTAA
ncbi:MAG: hypothetical protein V1725_05750, partial [archaeon]